MLHSRPPLKLTRSWAPAGSSRCPLVTWRPVPALRCHSCTCDQALAAGLGSAGPHPGGPIPAHRPSPSRVPALRPGQWPHAQSQHPPAALTPALLQQRVLLSGAGGPGSRSRLWAPQQALGTRSSAHSLTPQKGRLHTGHLAPPGLALSLRQRWRKGPPGGPEERLAVAGSPQASSPGPGGLRAPCPQRTPGVPPFLRPCSFPPSPPAGARCRERPGT